jgi:hypothetical protein
MKDFRRVIAVGRLYLTLWRSQDTLQLRDLNRNILTCEILL